MVDPPIPWSEELIMSQTKAAIVILSDPSTGSEESVGRVFNALAVAYDYQNEGDEVTILFQGTGTRWIAELTKPDHPVHDLYEAVKDRVAGASAGCSEVFASKDSVKASGVELLGDNAVPGTAGLPSLRRLRLDGYEVYSF